MTTNVEAYADALAERDAAIAEAKRIAALVQEAASILAQDALAWRFEPVPEPPILSDRYKERGAYRIDVDIAPNSHRFIDPTTWPSIDDLRAKQQRVSAAERKRADAYALLSEKERKLVPAPRAPNQRSVRSRS